MQYRCCLRRTKKEPTCVKSGSQCSTLPAATDVAAVVNTDDNHESQPLPSLFDQASDAGASAEVMLLASKADAAIRDLLAGLAFSTTMAMALEFVVERELQVDVAAIFSRQRNTDCAET